MLRVWGKRRIIMLVGRSRPKIKALWKPLAVLVMIALVGLHPSRSWSQGSTYKAPIPKPSSQPPGKGEEKKPAPVDYENEMKKLNSLIAANDRNVDAFYNRGWLYEYKGNLQMAEKDYTKAIALNKNHLEAYYNRGLIFAGSGKLNEAISDFSEVLRLDPKSADAYCNRGNAYLGLKNPDQSIKDYNAALQIRPDDPDILCNRGIAYLQKGDKPKALDDFKKAAAAGHVKAREHLKLITQES
jgi:tetratricopeptide (TPR) repeat protein